MSLFLLFIAVCCLVVSQTAWAEVADLEKELQASLEQSGKQVSLVARKLERGLDASPEIVRLRTLSENIRITHLLLEERFRLREERVQTLGSSALSRQQAMAEGYKAALTEYLSLMDSLPANGSIPQSALRNLQSLLDKLLPKRKHPIIGSLPYKHLNLPAIEPASAPAITPAYKGGNKTISFDDTKATSEAPFSKEIAALAQSFGWNPVSIYEYVKNNVETEWYWGCMKGAEETLRQKSGNDCDQAALLVALLRASLYPTRYVRGVIEFFPDIERAKDLTGIDDPAKIAEFFQKAGIPYRPVIAGGKIANFQIEHIWVETQVPYSNYRGNLIDEHGKVWLGLDTSIKVKGYEYNQPKDLLQELGVNSLLSGIRDEYLGLATAPTDSTPLELNQTPLEYLQSSINSELQTQSSQFVYADFLRTRVLLPEHMKILPASLQFGQVKVTNEYTAIPEELKHRLKLSAVSSQQSANGGTLLEITLDVLKLSNQQIILSYEPETVQDQEIINSFGGLDSTPAYLVRLRPVVKVNGERIVVATDGLPMGADYTLTIDLITPSDTETVNNTLIVGNLTVIGITAQKAVLTPSPLAGEGGGEGPKDAERLLYEAANHYIDRWNASENELASLLHLSITRPLPTFVTLGGVIDVTYLLDQPHGFTWKGVYLDADLRSIEVVDSRQSAVGGQSISEQTRLFMQLSSLQGSVLEHRLFEDNFKVESISTAKLFQLVSSQSGTSILTIDKTNVDAILPTLDIAENIKDDIRNSVNRNFAIRIPQSEITYHDWSGIGYIKENLETGESGWMLSGMIAGSYNADSPEDWANQYHADVLGHPYGGEFNSNPLAAAKIINIDYANRQRDYVDKTLEKPLAVLVLDSTNKPVKGADVTFTVKAGEGTLQCLAPLGAVVGQSGDQCTTKTGGNGIVKAKLTLGKVTGKNPIYMTLETTDVNSTQVGLNLVDAYVIGWGGQVGLDHPFEAYGMPDVYGPGKKIETVFPMGTTGSTVVSGVTISNTDIAQSGMPNNPGGSLLGRLMDRHGNPISNARLQFASLLMTSQTPTVPLPQEARKIRFYDSAACTVAYPLYGECGPYVETTTPLTDYNGGMTNFVYGNSVNTAYTIMVTAPTFTDVPAVAWTLHIAGYAATSDAFFNTRIEIGSLDLYSVNGDLVNAAKAGEELKADLKAKLYLIQSDFTEGAIDACKYGQMTLPCKRVQPKGTITTVPVSYGLVTFKTATGNGIPLPSLDMGNGLYQAKYQTGTVPAKNIIEALGEAAITVPVMYYDDMKKAYVKLVLNPILVTLKTGQTVYFSPNTGSTYVGICGREQGTNETVCVETDDPKYLQKTTYTAYGIGVDTVVEPSIVLLDDSGRTTVDTTIKYTVQPPEYKAAQVDIDLLKAINSIDNVWMDVLYANQTQGQGSAVIGRGSKTDVESLYKAQVVMNRGSMMEVKGKEKDIPVAQIRVLTDESTPKETDEIKFGDGSNKKKKYKIELTSLALMDTCVSLSGSIRVVDKNGQTITVPGAQGEYYSSNYTLDFHPTLDGKCYVSIDTAGGMDKFIQSNLQKTVLIDRDTVPSDTAVIYGGIGNTYQIEINGSRKVIPIEPVGVIVLGIDGLRQDVLYAPSEQQVNDPSGSYYVPSAELKGLCEVLGGKYNEGVFGIGSGCDDMGMENRHIKLQNVTAIFPSITVASWASIFTGKMPRETGILGNEFFARDLMNKNISWNGNAANMKVNVPERYNNPAGVISFSSGAFKGYDTFGVTDLKDPDFFIPYYGYWTPSVNPGRTPQNDRQILKPDTLYENIVGRPAIEGMPDQPGIQGVRDYFASKGGDSVVAANSHYARGAYWLTWALTWSWYGDSETLDKTAWMRLDDYMKGKYLTPSASSTPSNYPRNNIPFSALTVLYLPGLDHEAHILGMDEYRNYVIDDTDRYIKYVVDWLKKYDEFDNKIFVVVADHGMTAMPTNLKYKDISWMGGAIEVFKDVEMSCKLKLDFLDPNSPDHAAGAQKAEKANNNLHIWELGDALKALQKKKSILSYRVLAPKEITELFINAPAGARKNLDPQTDFSDYANVVAAFNGPMAHIYLKGEDWQSQPDAEELKKLAEVLRVFYHVEDSAEARNALGIDAIRYLNLLENNVVRLKQSVDKILIRIGGQYFQFDGYGPNGYVLNQLSLGTEYVKASVRIPGMNDIKRSGDIVLVMKDSVVGPEFNRFTTGVACKSWHGSLNSSDSFVPFIVAYPGGNKMVLETYINNTQGCSLAQGCDGNWKVTDLIQTIVQNQYSSQ